MLIFEVNINEIVLEIDFDVLVYNYYFLKFKINFVIRMMVVVKVFGYGSDVVEVVKELVNLGVDYFVVVYVNEGEVLWNNGVIIFILVLYFLFGNFDVILKRCLEFNIYFFKILKEFIVFVEEY